MHLCGGSKYHVDAQKKIKKKKKMLNHLQVTPRLDDSGGEDIQAHLNPLDARFPGGYRHLAGPQKSVDCSDRHSSAACSLSNDKSEPG